MCNILRLNIGVRIGVYRLLNEMATYDWGISAIVSLGGLTERLLDRDMESDIRALPFKFSVLQKLGSNKHLARLGASQALCESITSYVHQVRVQTHLLKMPTYQC
jgi:hypothetical protein